MKKENFAFDEKAILDAMKKALKTNPNENGKTNDKKKPRKLAPEWQLATMIKRKFQKLPAPLQNTDNKRVCIEDVLAGHPRHCPDPMRFKVWLAGEANMLADRTWDFQKTCAEAKINDIQAVAQHLVLEGKRVCNDIRINGLAAYGGNIKMFSERLVNIDDLIRPEKKEEGHE